ncbi:hypothetical protein GCM10025784_11100 [Citricoccus nitrophenolicus]
MWDVPWGMPACEQVSGGCFRVGFRLRDVRKAPVEGPAIDTTELAPAGIQVSKNPSCSQQAHIGISVMARKAAT